MKDWVILMPYLKDENITHAIYCPRGIGRNSIIGNNINISNAIIEIIDPNNIENISVDCFYFNDNDQEWQFTGEDNFDNGFVMFGLDNGKFYSGLDNGLFRFTNTNTFIKYKIRIIKNNHTIYSYIVKDNILNTYSKRSIDSNESSAYIDCMFALPSPEYGRIDGPVPHDNHFAGYFDVIKPTSHDITIKEVRVVTSIYIYGQYTSKDAWACIEKQISDPLVFSNGSYRFNYYIDLSNAIEKLNNIPSQLTDHYYIYNYDALVDENGYYPINEAHDFIITNTGNNAIFVQFQLYQVVDFGDDFGEATLIGAHLPNGTDEDRQLGSFEIVFREDTN